MTQHTNMDSESNGQKFSDVTAVEDEGPQKQAYASSDDMLESDDDQLLPLEYARRYGLTKSHLHDPYDAVNSPPAPGVARADLQDPEPTLNIDNIFSDQALESVIAVEKWDVDRGTATYLASVGVLGRDDPSLTPQHIDGPVYLCDLKLEEAVLASDPELDLCRLKRRNRVIISSSGMRLFELNSEKGESFAWSATERQACSSVENLIAKEKLDVDIETLTYLKEEIVSLGRQTDEDAMFAGFDHRSVSKYLLKFTHLADVV